MSEITMLTVKTDFDDSGLRKMEAKVSASLETARRLVDQFNKNTELALGIDAFAKTLQKIEQELKSLRKECSRVELVPDTAQFEKTLENIEQRLNGLEKDYQITLNVDTAELERAAAQVAAIGQKQGKTEGASEKNSDALAELEKNHGYENTK